MGASRDDFVKYPRTPHLFGSRGTDDDKHLGGEETSEFIADPSLIVEEKLDGTNASRDGLRAKRPPQATGPASGDRRSHPQTGTPAWDEAHGLSLIDCV